MTDTEKVLNDYGLHIVESDAPDRCLVDFYINDGEDNVAWVYGDKFNPSVECNHPSELIEYDDDETVGECLLCGATCDWHNEPDEYGNTYKEPHEWYEKFLVGGLISKYLEELYGIGAKADDENL